MNYLVDSCVLLDILTEDKIWFDWSSEMIEACADSGNLSINPIIYSEVSISFKNIEDLEDTIPSTIFKRLPLPWEAAFLAGKSFLKYRKSSGCKNLPLPDFFIGAHALIEDLCLLTRDTKRFLYYYPKLKLISPEHQFN